MYDRRPIYFKSSEKQLYNSCLDAIKSLGYSVKIVPGDLFEVNVGGLFSKKKMIIEVNQFDNKDAFIQPQYIDIDDYVNLDKAFAKIINKIRQTTG